MRDAAVGHSLVNGFKHMSDHWNRGHNDSIYCWPALISLCYRIV